MKIGLIRRRFASAGGAELYLQRLIGGLKARGHQPHLFAQKWESIEEGVEFHHVASTGSRAKQPVNFAEAARKEIKLHPLDCILSLERSLEQDVYRAGDGVHRIWLERRRKFVPWWKKPFVGVGAFHRNMMQLESRTFDVHTTPAVIVNSEMVRSEIVECFSYPNERIHLIRNGVETTRFCGLDRSKARRQFGIRNDQFVVAFVGSGWERKGLNFLINALEFGRFSTGVRLIVAGKGKKPGNSPSGTIFTGAIKRVEEVYAAADLFVTLPIYEPSANVVSEALSAGLPVITTLQDGASELLEEAKTGSVIADPRDAFAVADKIRYWMDKGGAAGRAVVDVSALDIRRNVDETVALLEKLSMQRRCAS